MRQWMKSRWILGGLYFLTAMVVGASEAAAGTSAITITGGYKPGGGDPQYLYFFDVSLNAPIVSGTNTFTTDDYFTVDGLPGVTSGSLTSAPPPSPANPPFDVAWAVSIDDLHTPGSDSSNVTWTFLGTHLYSASNPATPQSPSTEFLGYFSVLSTFPFPADAPPFGGQTGTLSYQFSIDGRTGSGSGTFGISSVPEPSSALLLAFGSGCLPVVWLRKRRRRHQEQYSADCTD
jgi:hypothetical protein